MKLAGRARTVKESSTTKRTATARLRVSSLTAGSLISLLLLLAPEPFHEPADAVFDLRLRVVAEQTARLRHVRVSLRHVAWLRRLTLDEGRAVECFFQKRDQFPQLDGLRLAEVEDFVVARVVINRGAHARDDVVYVGVVAPRRAVAEDGDGAARVNQFGELVNRQVGPLARAVDREEAQAHAPHAVEVRVGVAQKLARRLRHRVGRDGLADRVLFAERYFRVDAVNGRGRAEDELLDSR